MKKVTILVGASVLVAGSAVALWLLKFSPDAKLVAECTAGILDELKAPGTARFSEVRQDGLVGGSGLEERRIRLAVDSENEFGALLRQFYACSKVQDQPAKYFALQKDVWRARGLLTESRIRSACQEKAREEYASAQPLPEPRWVMVGIGTDGSGTALFNVKSDAWGKATFACSVSIDGAAKVRLG